MMFVGDILAMCPMEDILKKYVISINLPVDSIEEANVYCQNNYLGYINISGFYDSEQPFYSMMFNPPSKN